MSSTIFCTFEQQDLADLAMGNIRRIQGVQSIRYTVERPAKSTGDHPVGTMGVFSALGAINTTADTGLGWNTPDAGTEPRSGASSPSAQANVRITCDDAVRDKVVSMLVNLHASRIVATP